MRSHRATIFPVNCLRTETSNRATLPYNRATIPAEPNFKLTLTEPCNLLLEVERKSVFTFTLASLVHNVEEIWNY